MEESFQAARHVHETALANRSGDGLEKARRLYARILQVDPDHAGTHHMMALAMSRLGDFSSAIESLRRALELSPSADAWNDLGTALHGHGSLAEAEHAWRQALLHDPTHFEAADSLGTMLKRAGRLDDALQLCETAVAANPLHGPSHYNLADALQLVDRPAEAIVHLRRAVELDPSDCRSRMHLGQALWEHGNRQEAAQAFSAWMAQDPSDPVARHMYAAACDVVSSRAADDYVVWVFDRYAEDFDEHLLGDLDYRVPRLIGQWLERAHSSVPVQLDVLDAGCGTGLCGPELRRYAKRLVGVDLSPAMLERAAETNSYDELARVELTDFLLRTASTFDLIVAADTFCYFAELRAPLMAAARVSRAQGELLFTVEESAAEPESGFSVMPHGRFVHGSAYLENVLEEAGWQLVSMDRVVLRKEAGAPVQGLLVHARKASR